MKLLQCLIFGVASSLIASCSQPIKRQAHFLPVFEGRILLSGREYFVDSANEIISLPAMVERRPKSFTSERLGDGSLRVVWISDRQRLEKLVYSASGLHPVEIPEAAIQETTDLKATPPLREPYVLRGFGPNTAFVEEFLELGDRIEPVSEGFEKLPGH